MPCNEDGQNGLAPKSPRILPTRTTNNAAARPTEGRHGESIAKNQTLQTSGINARTKKIYMNHFVGVDSYINVVFYQ